MSATISKPTKRQRQRAASEARAAARRRRQQRKRLGRILGASSAAAVLTVAIVVLTSGRGAGPAATGAVDVAGPPRIDLLATGEAIPDFAAPGLSGGRVLWRDHVGEPTVLAIWAPWCPACQEELPVLDRVVRQVSGVSLVTIVTAIGDRPGPTPEGYLADHGLSFPTAVDDDAGSLAAAFGLHGFPTIYFVDSTGAVVSSGTGVMGEEALRGAIGALS